MCDKDLRVNVTGATYSNIRLNGDVGADDCFVANNAVCTDGGIGAYNDIATQSRSGVNDGARMDCSVIEGAGISLVPEHRHIDASHRQVDVAGAQ